MKQLRILLGIALIFLLLSGCTRNHRASTDDRAATSGEETVAGRNNRTNFGAKRIIRGGFLFCVGNPRTQYAVADTGRSLLGPVSSGRWDPIAISL